MPSKKRATKLNKLFRDVRDSLLGCTSHGFNPRSLTGSSYPIDWNFALDVEEFYFQPKDEQGVPRTRDVEGRPLYFPTRVATYAFAHFNRHIERRDATSHEVFLRMAAWFMAADDGIWRYHCDFTFANGTLKGPWISAMAQGQGISVLTRAYALTGEERYLDRARQALAPLLVPLAEGGVRSRIDGLWEFLEEYPLPRPRHTLNGFLFALIGLVDLAAVVTEAAGRVRLPALSASLVHNLGRWELGYWSAYDAHRTAAGLPNPATVAYHRVHVAQLRWLGARLGEPALVATAERWFERQRRLRHRLRALHAKITYRRAEQAGYLSAATADTDGRKEAA